MFEMEVGRCECWERAARRCAVDRRPGSAGGSRNLALLVWRDFFCERSFSREASSRTVPASLRLELIIWSPSCGRDRRLGYLTNNLKHLDLYCQRRRRYSRIHHEDTVVLVFGCHSVYRARCAPIVEGRLHAPPDGLHSPLVHSFIHSDPGLLATTTL